MTSSDVVVADEGKAGPHSPSAGREEDPIHGDRRRCPSPGRREGLHAEDTATRRRRPRSIASTGLQRQELPRGA